MTSFLPDLNVWLALSWVNHRHSAEAWEWFSRQDDAEFCYCRLTQLGLLRLLATRAIMGDEVLTVGDAWKVYDRWLEDLRIGIRPESPALDRALRQATRPVARLASPKAIGDCYLMAVCQSMGTTLVTFDRGLAAACVKAKQPVVLPG